MTHDELLSLVVYEPDTGLFIRDGKPTGSTLTRAGGRKYVRIRLCGEYFYAHRLAHFYMTGAWPKDYIDHINGDGADNRWDNLRPATQTENLWNMRLVKRGKVPLKGVSTHVRGGFRATIKIDGRQVSLGYYKCPAAAHFAYITAADKFFGEFANAG